MRRTYSELLMPELELAGKMDLGLHELKIYIDESSRIFPSWVPEDHQGTGDFIRFEVSFKY